MLKIQTLTYNPWQENTYLIVAENRDCIIVDPGCITAEEQQHLVSYLKDNNLNPVRMINTHLHLDHVFGCNFVSERFNLGLEAHKGDEFWIDQTVSYAAQMGIQLEKNPPKISNYIEDGQIIQFGDSEIEILHVPGHSPGGVVLFCKNEKKAIVGDVLFRESIGRADLPGGDFDTLINSIKSKLLVLDDDVQVYSGHGPSTTIGHERNHNMYF